MEVAQQDLNKQLSLEREELLELQKREAEARRTQE